jgi:predicted Fe-Mo cluster-binding NifX family protein
MARRYQVVVTDDEGSKSFVVRANSDNEAMRVAALRFLRSRGAKVVVTATVTIKKPRRRESRRPL